MRRRGQGEVDFPGREVLQQSRHTGKRLCRGKVRALKDGLLGQKIGAGHGKLCPGMENLACLDDAKLNVRLIEILQDLERETG